MTTILTIWDSNNSVKDCLVEQLRIFFMLKIGATNNLKNSNSQKRWQAAEHWNQLLATYQEKVTKLYFRFLGMHYMQHNFKHSLYVKVIDVIKIYKKILVKNCYLYTTQNSWNSYYKRNEPIYMKIGVLCQKFFLIQLHADIITSLVDLFVFE